MRNGRLIQEAVQTLTMAAVAAAALNARGPSRRKDSGPRMEELRADDPDDRRPADVAGSVDRRNTQDVASVR